MARKKGSIPAHVENKHFMHPGIEHPIIQLLEGVEDPRGPSLFFRHSLTSMLFMTIVTIMCGATDWPKVRVMAEGMCEWLKKYVDMTGGGCLVYALS